MSIKKMFVGEKMPDKNDPKYRERYEREVNYGRRFADKTGITLRRTSIAESPGGYAFLWSMALQLCDQILREISQSTAE